MNDQRLKKVYQVIDNVSDASLIKIILQQQMKMYQVF